MKKFELPRTPAQWLEAVMNAIFFLCGILAVGCVAVITIYMFLSGREAGSGTRDGFESIVDVKDSCKYAQELTATGAVISAVEANPLAIGYASLSAIGDTVKAVTVGGVECSEETVKDGSYEVQRPFVFVTNDSVTLSAQAQAFLDFATSADAADLIRTAGAVPVNE